MKRALSYGSRVRQAGCTVGLACAIGGLAAVLGAASGGVAVAARSRPPRKSGRALDVLPFPGTPDAAPGTSIDLPAASPAQIQSVTAVGSRSGLHLGRLSAQPAGRGTAFSPSRPFSPGERVSVTATFRSAAAGRASGAPGAEQVRFSFSVARPAALPSRDAAVAGGLASSGAISAVSPSKTHSFVTEPGFHVPWISMSGRATDPRAGDIFLDAGGSGQHAAYMLNPRGRVLWYQPAATQGSGPHVVNTRVQTYHHHRVITYWEGSVLCPPCVGWKGRDVVLNRSYKTIHTVTAGNGYQQQGTDLHEFSLTPQGTALVGLWSPVHKDLTSVGGPQDGIVYDWIIQEIDVATDKVVWEWHSLGHIPIDATHSRYIPGQPFDYFHLNSIQQLPSGRILISARNTWAVYSIDKKTGKVAWELGGKHSSFKLGRGTHFYWQHDATLHGDGLLTLFDDGAAPKEESQSRALEIHLGSHRATLVHAYTHKPSTLAGSEGSVQLLADHNVFVGWGQAPYFSEYTPAGRQIFGGTLLGAASYRAYRAKWTGNPPWPPAIAVRKTSTRDHYNVYASWNGQNQVAHWRVLAGSSSTGPFKPLRTIGWSSFETTIPVSTGHAYFEVEGLGQKGKVLHNGVSAVVQAR